MNENIRNDFLRKNREKNNLWLKKTAKEENIIAGQRSLKIPNNTDGAHNKGGREEKIKR